MQTDTRQSLNSFLALLNKTDSVNFDFEAFLDEIEACLSADSCRQVQTLLGNLRPFQDHLDEAQKKTWQLECPLFKAFKADLMKSARGTLISMLQNCLEAADAASNHSIKSLLAGKEADVRSLVPSRMLARELGVSDQTLRREIYLARQKAAIPKHNLDDDHEDVEVADRSFVESLTNTCASPVHGSEDDDDEWLDVEAWLKAEIFA